MVNLTGWLMQINIPDFAHRMKAIMELPMLKNSEKKAHLSQNVLPQLMRDLGSIQAPQNAFILNLGLESLHVRMPRHVENGQAVAEFLEQHPKVAYVNYPGLPSNKYS